MALKIRPGYYFRITLGTAIFLAIAAATAYAESDEF